MTKKLLRGLLCAALCVGVASGAVALTAFAQDGDDIPALEQTYSKNESIVVPEKQITVNGTQYATTAKVVFPDGSTHIAGKNGVTLTSAGVYTVVYYAIVNGNYHEETATFTVNEESYTINGKKTTVYYGHHGTYATEKNGLVMSIGQKDSVSFNRIVDLKDFTDEPVISLFATPETLGTEDASELIVTFTDVYDPTNVVTLNAHQVNYIGEWAENSVYTQVGASEDEMVGLEVRSPSNPGGVTVLGGYYGRNVNGQYGSPISFSLSGWLNNGEKIGDRMYEIYWDYAEKSVYHSNTKMKRLISELDNSLLYSNPWDGFTTGEVFISLSAKNYTSTAMNLVVTKIGNYDLSEKDFTVTSEPVITVDYAGYDKTALPYAVSGMGYDVFEATGWDFYDGETDVSAKVYYNYRGNNPYQYTVKDGKFIPDRAGLYTIVYTAKNACGLTSQTFVDVTAITTEDTLAIEVDAPVSSAVAGDNVKVANAYALANVSGNGTIEITATLKSDPTVSYKVDTKTLSFSPYYAGVYEIRYVASDYLTTAEKKFDLTVSANPEPFIKANVAFPEKLIVGNTYKFPTAVYAYDLSTGKPIESKAKATVQEDGSVATALAADGLYTVGDCEKVTVKYSITANGHTATKTFEIPVVKVKDGTGAYDVTKFFEADKTSCTISADYSFVYFGVSEDTTIGFINPVRGDSLDLMLSFSNITYSGVSVYLKDVNDTTKSVKITLKNEGTIKVYINDAYKAEFSGKFADYKATSLNMVYDGEKVRFGELASVAIEEYENGNEFLGFGETVTFRLGVEGVTGAGELALVKLNNQYMYDFDGDLIEAEVAVKKIAGERVLNDTVTLPVAFGYDVLTGYTNVTLQVKAPDGTTVQASDGTLLDGKAPSTTSYTFTLTQYGMYTIAYSAMDGNGNALNYTYVIPCADAVAPTVMLEYYNRTAKVGDTVSIPKLMVSDDLTADADLTVYKCLFLPDDRCITLTSDAFTVTQAGTYRIYYNVYDATGNLTQAYCTLVVTE